MLLSQENIAKKQSVEAKFNILILPLSYHKLMLVNLIAEPCFQDHPISNPYSPLENFEVFLVCHLHACLINVPFLGH